MNCNVSQVDDVGLDAGTASSPSARFQQHLRLPELPPTVQMLLWKEMKRKDMSAPSAVLLVVKFTRATSDQQRLWSTKDLVLGFSWYLAISMSLPPLLQGCRFKLNRE